VDIRNSKLEVMKKGKRKETSL